MKKIFCLAAATLMIFTGCVKDDVYTGPSNIEKVTFSPEAPTSFDDVVVTATITGLQAVKSAKVTYNGTDVAMTGSGTTYTGTIPAMADGTDVEFTVTVVNAADFTTVSDKFTYKVGDPATDWTKLKLNELYASASSDDGKFIELYNDSDNPIKLTGVTINKDENLTWTGIDGEVIPAKGVFAIVGAKGSTERGFSSGFSAKKTVIIELYDPNGNKLDTFQRGTLADGKTWGDDKLTEIAEGTSWSRIPDGTGAWKLASVTVNAKNATTGTDDTTVVQ